MTCRKVTSLHILNIPFHLHIAVGCVQKYCARSCQCDWKCIYSVMKMEKVLHIFNSTCVCLRIDMHHLFSTDGCLMPVLCNTVLSIWTQDWAISCHKEISEPLFRKREVEDASFLCIWWNKQKWKRLGDFLRFHFFAVSLSVSLLLLLLPLLPFHLIPRRNRSDRDCIVSSVSPCNNSDLSNWSTGTDRGPHQMVSDGLARADRLRHSCRDLSLAATTERNTDGEACQ